MVLSENTTCAIAHPALRTDYAVLWGCSLIQLHLLVLKFLISIVSHWVAMYLHFSYKILVKAIVYYVKPGVLTAVSTMLSSGM
jgi:hypothetical protein